MMGVRIKQFFAAIASAALVLSPIAATPASAQRTQVGNASSVVGNVTMRTNGKGKKKKVVRKQRFAWGDVITTAKKSQLQIMLRDRSTYGVGARSQVRIDRYVYNPGSGRTSITTIIKGSLRFFSGRRGGRNSAEVRTPAGRIGIRGTAVDMIVGKDAEKIAEKEDFVGKVKSDKDEATLVVLRGPGAATEGGLTPGIVDVEGAGVTVTLDQPGFAAYIARAGAAPIGPFRISDKGLGKVQDKMAPEVARASGGGSILNTLIPVAIGAIALGVLLDGNDNNDNPNNPTNTNPNDNDIINTDRVPNPTSTQNPNNANNANNPNNPNNPDSGQNDPPPRPPPQ
jgi:hypothetical protein